MILRDCKPSKNNSFFLFGPRGTGKTTLLEQTYTQKTALFVDLLDPETYDNLVLDRSRFSDLINQKENKEKIVIIDEVQKLPGLLDIVHREIQKNKRIFVLTGSSSRRLKQKGSNLLAGRAWVYSLYPFSSFELKEKFNLQKCLEYGSLPDAALSKNIDDAKEYLNAYTGTYLQKEIQEERWVRKISPFRKFLEIAAQMNGKLVNKASIAKEVGVNDVTVSNYFEILEDTLIGFFLPAHHSSIRKSQRHAPKFYFIDTGIKRALDKTLSVPLVPKTNAYGDAFEHWVILEVKKLISYKRLDWELFYYRTKSDVEIDLVIQRPGDSLILIEIKSKDKVSEKDAFNLETLGEDLDENSTRYLLSNDSLEKNYGKTRAIFWVKGLGEIFDL